MSFVCNAQSRFSFLLTHDGPKAHRPRDAAPGGADTPVPSTGHVPSTSASKTSLIRRLHRPSRAKGALILWIWEEQGEVYPELTQSAGRLVGESWRQWELWIRCLWTSSSAEGSVQKWSAVFILVYSSAQGPTVERNIPNVRQPSLIPLLWSPPGSADHSFGIMGVESKEGKQVKKVLPNKDARIGPSTGSIRRASFS